MVLAGGILIALSVVYWAAIEYLMSITYNLQGFLMLQAPISVSVGTTFLAGIILIAAGIVLKQLRVNSMIGRAITGHSSERPTALAVGVAVIHQYRGLGVILRYESERPVVAFENGGELTCFPDSIQIA